MIIMAKKNITYMDFNREDYINTTHQELFEIWMYQCGLHNLTNKQQLAAWEINHRITGTPYISQDIESMLYKLRFGGETEQTDQMTIQNLISKMN